ncbi:MAG: protein-disulfide reductase DsbD, partial [Gammaproteobacteria bacterium]|nr:protein-disulfide reductase DsbD [Gammaproteobacteria bacterium]
MNKFLFWLLLITVLPAMPALSQSSAVSELQSLLQNTETIGDDELLPPEKAFAVRVVPDAADLVAIEYQVAEGYYLYRDKFRFESATPGVELGTAWVPAGERKHDEFFGEVETHRGLVSIGLPLLQRPADLQDLSLVLTSQGCADVGVCYPPFTQTVAVALPAPDDQSALAAVTELGDALGVADAEPELLDPDQAFAISIDDTQSGQLVVAWDIADGYYMYQERMAFKVDELDDLALGVPRFSESKIKDDEFFGRMAVFYHQAMATLPVAGPATTARTKLYVQYQGCAEIGVCYPPIAKTFDVNLSGGASSSVVKAPPTDDGDFAGMSEQDRIAASLGSNSLWLIILSFLGLGLLLTFTPCVLPMIPILSSIIAGQGTDVTTRKAFSLSLTYVLAMAFTYTVAGVLVGLSGENVQAVFQDPWILGIFAGVFVLLSLSMFGFYELQMPAAVQSKLTALSNSQQGGTYTGVAIMGFLSALIVGPCVTAPLVGALIYIAQTGDAVLGGLALFALSMGMGVPLLVIGTSAGKLLPKAGPWMDATKAVFGVLLLGLAIWLLERILPVAVTMALWAVLLLISAIYLGALEPIREGASGWFRLWKGVGLTSLVVGVLLLIGAAAGSHSMLQPLKGVFSVAGAPGAQGTAASGVEFTKVKGLQELQQAIARANADQQTVMLDFYADCCISCKEMEAFTFSDPGVQAALSRTVWLQTDVTLNDEQ